ncbi:MAG: Flp1 family type IVb pilin [Anaerocolumna sp.]
MKNLMNLLVSFMQEEDGLGVVEIILIIVVLIGLVIIFRDNIETVINSIFDTINERVGDL